MPLIAELDGRRMDATKMTAEAWAALQAAEDRRRLVMPVCGMRAIAKKRGEGTQFFAHHVADCGFDHGDESAQHLAMKTAVAARIDAVPGWHAAIEFPHPSREWVIDVLAESDDGNRRVAFEVQLSGQTPEAYFRRSERYFRSGIFPAWLIPRPLEWNPIRVPEVVTGFMKSSDVPGDFADLMTLVVAQDFVPGAGMLGEFIDALLCKGHQWDRGSPTRQKQRIEAEQRRAEQDRQAAAAKQEEFRRSVEETNARCTAPEKAFGMHTVRVAGGPYIWAALMECWRCGFPSMVWDATTPRPGQRHSLETVPDIKSKVGLKRFENHPDVHRAIDRWMAVVGSDVMKAEIDLRKSKARGATYSGFTCPFCEALSGQFFISQVQPWRWSLICAPEQLKPAPKATVAVKRARHEPLGPRRPPKVIARPPAPEQPSAEPQRGYEARKTWDEIHSPEGVEEARRKFLRNWPGPP
ncbi:hypothetical protein B5P43_15700 [Bacillus sp. SRB_336]|nr:hypothetical protein B5P43_15700 [Bacillus sp. SRB_336]